MRAILAALLVVLSGVSLLASSVSGTGTSTAGNTTAVHSVVVSAPPLPAYSSATTYYVSPTGTGTIGTTGCRFTAPCPIGLLNGTLSAGTVVVLRGGFYYLPLVTSSTYQQIEPASSGTLGNSIVFTAYPSETPIITDAVPLTGWKNTCAILSDPACWSTTLPSGFTNFDYLIYVPAGWPPSYVANVMSRRSEAFNTPSGYDLIASLAPAGGMCTTTGGVVLNCVNVNASDVTTLTAGGGPYNPNDVRFYNFRNATVDVLRMNPPSPSGLLTTLEFTGNASGGFAYGFNVGTRYLIANSREYFENNDTPGTFYLDCGTTLSGGSCVGQTDLHLSTLYYIAKPGESPATDLILAPQVPTSAYSTPTPATPPPSPTAILGDYQQNYLTFSGLVFAGDDWVSPMTGYQGGPTSPPALPAAVSFVDTTGVTVHTSVIAHTSGYGLEFTNDNCSSTCSTAASAYNGLLNSAIYDTGGSGLRVGRFPLGSTADTGNSALTATQFTQVVNNLITATGRIYPNGEDGCVWIGSSHDNLVQYNECSDSYGGGIAVGPFVGSSWNFGYNNTVANNNFHDIGEGVIIDFGCVHIANYGGYSGHNSGAAGDYFQNNICHDLTHAVKDPAGNGATGIYIDQNSQYVTAQYNLIYRASGEIFYNNASPLCPSAPGTCNNVLASNILAYGAQGSIRRDGNDGLRDFTFKHNIVYYDVGTGPQFPQVNGFPVAGWNCAAPTACTTFFAFYSNGYYSPMLPNALVNPVFSTTGTGGGTFQSLVLWQVSPYPGEETTIDTTNATYADPLFVNPVYPLDDYRFQSGATVPSYVGFDSTDFAATYNAGRSNAGIFAPATAPSFPLQLISPFQF